MSELKKLIINGQEYTITDSGAVAFDEPQTLTDEQKAQARENIGANTLIVTVTDDTASHSTTEIYNAVQAGNPVVLLYKGEYFTLSSCVKTYAYFTSADDGQSVYVVGVGEDCTVEYYENVFTTRQEVEDMMRTYAGADGEDGFSPVATVTQTDSGAVISITDANGTTTATVTNGKDGNDGAKGDKGDKGDTGAAGADGTSVTVASVSESAADGGSNVVTFSDGKTITIKNGSKGSTGATGEKGDKGDTGAQGIQGVQGEQGEKGDKGDTGDPGLTWRGEWSDSITDYIYGDVVYHNGSAYVFDNESNPESEPGVEDSVWSLLAAKGDTGEQGPAYTLTDTDKTTIASAVKASLTTESWTFTLEDGSGVTKAVYVG